MRSFKLVNCDTDGIMFCNDDCLKFSEGEINNLLKEINDILPEKIKFESEGQIDSVIVLKKKNYILYSKGKLKTKGSALRDSKQETAIKEMKNKIIDLMIKDASPDMFLHLYNEYVTEAMNIQDIKRWSSKKTLTEKVETSERANETKLKDAVAGSEYVQSDKVWVFFKENEELCLAENFTGDYNKKRLLKKLYNSVQVFSSVLPVKELFKNYSLKKNAKELNLLINIEK